MKTIPLTKGMKAIVDDSDYKWLNQWKWYYSSHGYVCRDEKDKVIYMHRFIMDAPDGVDVDHRNTKGFDCRRENLRLATRSQNNYNRPVRKDNGTGYKGVGLKKDQGRVKPYYARITVNKKKIHLGYYETAEEAAKAYDEAALKYHGEFARINF